MKHIYLRTDFPNGLSHILMRNLSLINSELRHYLLVLSNKGELWVDIYWPFNEEIEKYTDNITEQEFWHTFREWRLQGLVLGDNERVAEVLARLHLNRKKLEKL